MYCPMIKIFHSKYRIVHIGNAKNERSFPKHPQKIRPVYNQMNSTRNQLVNRPIYIQALSIAT